MLEDDGIDLAALAPLSDADPRITALTPRQRAELAAYRDFVSAPDDIAAERLAAADRELEAALDRAMGVPGSASGERTRAPAPAEGLAARLRRWWFGPALRPALALAAVVVMGGMLMWSPWRSTGPTMRGEGERTLEAREPAVSASDVTFAWESVAEADRYEVLLFASDLEERGRHDAGTGTTLTLARGSLGTASDEWVWQVIAYAGDDEIARSSPAAFRLDKDR